MRHFVIKYLPIILLVSSIALVLAESVWRPPTWIIGGGAGGIGCYKM